MIVDWREWKGDSVFRLLSIGIDVLSALIFVIPVVYVLQYEVLRQRSFSKLAAVMIFTFYLVAMFSSTGIPTITSWKVQPEFNLIPLIDIVSSPLDYIKNTVLNIILFVPLGFLVPVIWKEYRSLRAVLLMGFALSLFIEVLQIFTFRLTDVDDLITNTAGTVSGYCVGKLLSFRLPWRLSEKGGSSYSKYEPVVIITAAFVIGLCLKPFVSNMIWEEVLGSAWWEKIK